MRTWVRTIITWCRIMAEQRTLFISWAHWGTIYCYACLSPEVRCRAFFSPLFLQAVDAHHHNPPGDSVSPLLSLVCMLSSPSLCLHGGKEVVWLRSYLFGDTWSCSSHKNLYILWFYVGLFCTNIYYMSVREEGSFLCCSSWDFFHFFPVKGFFGGSFFSSESRVWGQRVSYVVQVVKPLEANCDLRFGHINKTDLTWFDIKGVVYDSYPKHFLSNSENISSQSANTALAL